MALADYHFVKHIGSGFFGSVYLVENKVLERQQALKIVPLTSPSDSAKEEARVLERFRGFPHVVEVDNASIERVELFGVDTDVLMIAMEYLERGSVGQEIARGLRLGAVSIRGVLIDALTGLDVLHSKSYTHRDIKPSNMLLTRSGTAKLSDFGLATLLGAGGTASPVGYRAHLPPEVIAGGGYSRLGDIYALGVTAYRLSCPDEWESAVAGTWADIEARILAGTFPSRSEYPLSVPLNLRKAINKAMRVDPAERYQSANEMKSALSGLTLRCDWVPITDPRGLAWSAHLEGREWRAVLLAGSSPGVVVEKRVSAKFQRVSGHCLTGSTDEAARRHARAFMQELTTQ